MTLVEAESGTIRIRFREGEIGSRPYPGAADCKRYRVAGMGLFLGYGIVVWQIQYSILTVFF